MKKENMTVEFFTEGITVYRERAATKAERSKDKDAERMVEVVTISFGKGEPKVSVNRDLCAGQ